MMYLITIKYRAVFKYLNYMLVFLSGFIYIYFFLKCILNYKWYMCIFSVLKMLKSNPLIKGDRWNHFP